MSSRPTTPPARAAFRPRPEAGSRVGTHAWTAILQDADDQCYGSLRKPTAQIDPNVTHFSVSCDIPNINDKGLAFPTALTIRAQIPYLSTTRTGDLDKHVVTVKIFAEGIRRMIICPMSEQTSVPEFISSMPEFVPRRTPLTKIFMVLNPKGMVCHGLHIQTPFPDAAAVRMLGILKRLFGWDYMHFTIYVLGTRSEPLAGPLDNVLTRQLNDTKNNLYEKFYRASNDRFLTNLDEMHHGEHRPVVLYKPDLPVSLNKMEMFTKYAMGIIQLNDFQQASATQFNETAFDMNVFDFGAGDNKVYFALLKSKTLITHTPREGECIRIKFTQDGMPKNDKWQAKVIAPVRHFLSSYICIKLYRPRQAHPPDAGEYTRSHEILEFVDTVLGSGELEDLVDEEVFEEAIEHTQTFEVKANLKLSETTFERQLDAIGAMQRGARYNTQKNPHELTFNPWTPSEEIKGWGEFLLMRDSVPKTYKDWLRPTGMKYVQHLTDADQLDAINNLFRKAPSPCGVLIGPAGTGKTVLMSTMIHAHVAAHGTKHIVGSPSNVGAIVAAKKIQAFFKGNPNLRGKIVMRAYHDGPEDSQPLGDSNGTRSPRSTPQADADIGVYSADGWFDTADSDAKRALNDMMTVIRKNVETGNVDDPRMADFNQSLAYHALCVLGYEGFPSNDFTTGYQEMAGILVDYLNTALDIGVDSLGSYQLRECKKAYTALYKHTIKNTSVLVGTLTYLAHPLFSHEFKYVDTFWTDESGMATIPDWMNVIARYVFKQAFILGDHNQLHPVVVGPSPLTGFMRCLEMSPIKLLTDAHWPAVTLTLNRRSAAGIIDNPSDLFYKGLVKAHPSSQDEGKHKWTAPVSKMLRETFSPGAADNSISSVAYFSSANASGVDRMTSSTFNPKNMAFCLNFIEKCVIQLGIPPEKIGYTSPYTAQVKRMGLALRKMENFHKLSFASVQCSSIDSFQGGSAPVMIGDYTASDKLGFMSDRGRNCVLLTRAEDFALFVGNKDIRAPRDESTNWPAMGFAMAGVSGVACSLSISHEWMSHQFA